MFGAIFFGNKNRGKLLFYISNSRFLMRGDGNYDATEMEIWFPLQWHLHKQILNLFLIPCLLRDSITKHPLKSETLNLFLSISSYTHKPLSSLSWVSPISHLLHNPSLTCSPPLSISSTSLPLLQVVVLLRHQDQLNIL